MAHARMDLFTRAYFEAALWSSNDESDDSGGEPLDKNYDIQDFDSATRDKMVSDCKDFQERFGNLIDDDDSPDIRKHGSSELAGHDFWMTRNGHGVGFWEDSDWPKHGEELDRAAKSYGEFDLYLGDPNEDGERLIYGSPLDARVGERRHRGVKASRHREGKSLDEARGHVVADFNTLNDLIAHAKRELGATHVSGRGEDTKIYFPSIEHGYKYEAASVWRKGGYWHAQAPSDQEYLKQLPHDAKPIATLTVRDYEAIDRQDRVIAGPFKHYGDARDAAGSAGAVRFVPSRGRPSKASELHETQFEVVNPDGRVISHITAPTMGRAQTELARGKNAGWYPRGSRIKGARIEEASEATRSAHHPLARSSAAPSHSRRRTR